MTGNEEGNIPGFHIAAFLDFLTVFCGQDGMYVDLHQFIHEGLAVREESPMAKTKIRQATGSRPATLSRSSRESIAAASWTVCSNSDLMDETIAADDPGIPNGRDNILTDTSCCLALSEYSRRPAAKPASCRTRIFEPPATPWPVTRRLRRRCPRESCLRLSMAGSSNSLRPAAQPGKIRSGSELLTCSSLAHGAGLISPGLMPDKAILEEGSLPSRFQAVVCSHWQNTKKAPAVRAGG